MEKQRLQAAIAQLKTLLDEFDAFGGDEELDELNAGFEDSIFLLENIDPEDEDAEDEIEGALEELDDLADGYEAYEELSTLVQRLRTLRELIDANIE